MNPEVGDSDSRSRMARRENLISLLGCVCVGRSWWDGWRRDKWEYRDTIYGCFSRAAQLSVKVALNPTLDYTPAHDPSRCSQRL